MPEAKVNPLYEKPSNKPKPRVKWYRGACPMPVFRSLSHAMQMTLDAFLDEALTHELLHDPVTDKSYWVSKKKPKP